VGNIENFQRLKLQAAACDALPGIAGTFKRRPVERGEYGIIGCSNATEFIDDPKWRRQRAPGPCCDAPEWAITRLSNDGIHFFIPTSRSN